MAVTIRRLHCRVRVTTGGDTTPNRPEGPARPMVQFAQPVAAAQAQSAEAPPPSETATDQRGPAGQLEPVQAGRVDPGQVMRRVHELMLDEARMARERGER